MSIKEIIAKIWLAKKKKQKFVTIPHDCDLKEGEYVKITRVE